MISLRGAGVLEIIECSDSNTGAIRLKKKDATRCGPRARAIERRKAFAVTWRISNRDEVSARADERNLRRAADGVVMNTVSFQSTSRDSAGQLPPTKGEVGTMILEAPPNGSMPKATRLEKRLLRHLLEAIGNPPVVAALWSGEELLPTVPPVTDSSGEPIRFRIGDRATLWKILIDPFFQFPDAYSNGRMQVDGDLETLMCLVAESSIRAPKASMWFTYIAKLLHWGGRNTLAGSQKHIHHHYDIGNEFYRLWLDENLLYTCAYFEEPTASIEQAQLSKMDHVCRKLELKPGESVIEAGCGWGGFAIHMAKNYGVRVKAYNISREQVAECVAGRRRKDSAIASNSCSRTGGRSRAPATCSCRSACSNTSARRITSYWATSSIAAFPPTDAA